MCLTPRFAKHRRLMLKTVSFRIELAFRFELTCDLVA